MPNPGSAISSKARGGSLAPIKEREEITRSADPNLSKSRAMAAAAAAQQMNVKNQASGYKSGAQGAAAAHGRPPRRDNISNHNVAQHRSPVIPAGKENLQLPPINPGGPRNARLASREAAGQNLRN